MTVEVLEPFKKKNAECLFFDMAIFLYKASNEKNAGS